MALTQITTDGIKDGTISSADLSDQSVTLAKLPHGTSSNDGKFLRANNGADPTFETVTGTTINNNADNRVITGSGTANTLEGESNLTFDGTNLLLNGKVLKFANVSSTPSASGNVHIYGHDTKLKMCGGSGIQFEEGGFTRWHITSGALHPHGTTYNNLGNSSNRVGNAYIQTSVDLVDNAKALFGTGDDLQIYHDGSDSYINDVGTGHLNIVASQVNILNTAANEAIAKFIQNGAVELYYDNSKKLETASDKVMFSAHAKVSANATYDLGASGARWNDLYIANDIDISDNGKLLLGNSDDLQIYHDGSHSYIDNTGTGNLYIKDAGIVRIRTASFGVDNADGSEALLSATANGAVELYYDNSKKFETLSNGAEVSGHLHLGDNNQLRLGNVGSGGDLRIYHDGTASIIDNNTGELKIQSDNFQFLTADASEKFIDCNGNGNVELYYDNSKKFETRSDGVDIHGLAEVNGDVRPNLNNTHDLGTSSLRWANVYTNDLNLSNEGGANDVDGTWGSYTIQEGAEDLFLVNKRSGKKYKFNLTEVS